MTCRDVPGQPGHPSSYPEGALTHHLQSKRWYAHGIVRSSRRMRLLQKPLGKVFSTAACISLPAPNASLLSLGSPSSCLRSLFRTDISQGQAVRAAYFL